MEDRSGKTYTLNSIASDPVQGQVVEGAVYHVEGLWSDITGDSWMNAYGNPAALHYGLRSGHTGLPVDNNVWYGKINGLGHLVHESEIGSPI